MSDFADIFDVKGRGVVQRGAIDAQWFRSRQELRTVYRNGDFRRELVIAVLRSDAPAQYANGRLRFVAQIEPKGVWHACTAWLPITRSGLGRRPVVLPCNAVEMPLRQAGVSRLPAVAINTSNWDVQRAWGRAVADLEALRLEDPSFERGVVVPAAGVPWFVTLFGRDTLIVSMQASAATPSSRTARCAAGRAPGDRDDPVRDMEPGKIPHEIRHGELAQTGLLPFTPYYGTHDATPLYVSVLSYLYHWLGDEAVIRRHLDRAERAIGWIDTLRRPRPGRVPGVRDALGPRLLQPGLEGCRRRDPARGRVARPAAARARASSRATCTTRSSGWPTCTTSSAGRGRRAGCGREARTLFDRFNDAFWWEEEGTYYLGSMAPSGRSARSPPTPGHLLQSGIVPPERAGRVVERLLRDDMWSGWGIRTLSSDHVAYNPFSYHTGTVWPHDNAVIAGGFRRYGCRAGGPGRQRAVRRRVPICRRAAARAVRRPAAPRGVVPGPVPGRERAPGVGSQRDPAVVAVLAGIHARPRRRGRLYVDPALPPWLPDLSFHNLRAGPRRGEPRPRRRRAAGRRQLDGFEVVHGPPPRVDRPRLTGRVSPRPAAGPAPRWSRRAYRSRPGCVPVPRPVSPRRAAYRWGG